MLVDMSDFLPFVTGLFVGLTAAILFKGKGKGIQETARTVKEAMKVKGECKMVFVVRNDLGMTKGKIASQCAHATLMCYKEAYDKCPERVSRWSVSGQPKVALKIDGSGDEGLQKLAQKADALGIVNCLVRDAGRTQIQSGTITVLGLGPAPNSLIDQVSGHLKLL